MYQITICHLHVWVITFLHIGFAFLAKGRKLFSFIVDIKHLYKTSYKNGKKLSFSYKEKLLWTRYEVSVRRDVLCLRREKNIITEFEIKTSEQGEEREKVHKF